jgi:hypothetical protein
LGRQLRPRKPRAKVAEPKEYQAVDDEETEDESEEDDDEETEDESEEVEDEEQEEVPQQRNKGRSRGGRQVTKDSKPPKRKKRSAFQKKSPKSRRLGTVAEGRATQTGERKVVQQISMLKAQVERLQMQVSSEQQHPTRGLPGPGPHATHNSATAAILRFTAQHMRANAVEVMAQMRADAVEELAAAITKTPQSEDVDSMLAHLQQTPGMPQRSEEVD